VLLLASWPSTQQGKQAASHYFAQYKVVIPHVLLQGQRGPKEHGQSEAGLHLFAYHAQQ
jgi:hypothetical protein